MFVFVCVCECVDVCFCVHDFRGKGRSGFELNCRIWSTGSSVGLLPHKTLSLRLLEPPVGVSLSLSLPHCPSCSLSPSLCLFLSIYRVLSWGQAATAERMLQNTWEHMSLPPWSFPYVWTPFNNWSSTRGPEMKSYFRLYALFCLFNKWFYSTLDAKPLKVVVLEKLCPVVWMQLKKSPKLPSIACYMSQD